jgi:hypothetical protein
MEVLSPKEIPPSTTTSEDGQFAHTPGVIYVNHDGIPREMTVAWIDLPEYGPISFICHRCHRDNTMKAEWLTEVTPT